MVPYCVYRSLRNQKVLQQYADLVIVALVLGSGIVPLRGADVCVQCMTHPLNSHDCWQQHYQQPGSEPTMTPEAPH